MEYIELARRSKLRLMQNDTEFHDKAERIVGLMRSLNIVPSRRATLWGHWHKLLAAMLVTAYEDEVTVDIHTRRKGTLSEAALTTNLIKWMDQLVMKGLLLPRNGSAQATGALLLAHPLIEQMQ